MEWLIDRAHSMIEFQAKHMMFTTVRGRFDSFEGRLVLEMEHPENSHVEGSVDVKSIDTGDANRDQHLRGPDFFDADNFGAMTFHSTSIQRTSDHEFKLIGDLTIHGVTRQITWRVESAQLGKDPWGNPRLGFSAETKLNRKDFGLSWNVALESGGWLVSDEIRIMAEIQAIPAQKDAEKTVEGEMEHAR